MLIGLVCQSQSDIYDVLPTTTAFSSNGRAPQGSSRITRSVWIITATEMAAAGYVNGDVINAIGFNLRAAQNIATTGNFNVYLENTADVTNNKSTTWATAIGTMVNVSNGTITIPATVDVFDSEFTGGTSFTYTGGGLYLAFDYQNLTGTLSTNNSVFCNDSLAGGIKSAFVTTTTPPATLSANSAFRPQTRLGVLVNCARPKYLRESFVSRTTSSVTIAWSGNSTTAIEYGITGFTPGTGTQVYGITSPYTINGLTDSTIYDFTLVNNCGTLTSPVLSEKITLTTNTVFTPSNTIYNTSFEQPNFGFLGWNSTSTQPNAENWQILKNAAGSTLIQNGLSAAVAITPVATTTAPAVTAASCWIYSRGINLTAGISTTVTLYERNYNDTGATKTASYRVSYGIDQTAASQTTIIGTETGLSNTTYALKTYTFTPATTGIYYFGIQHITPANASTTLLHALLIDNFSVTQASLATETFSDDKISVFPNPANKTITISNSENINISEITIVDLNGRIIKTQKFSNISNIEISLTDLTSGIYLMNINTDKGIVTKKIVKE